MARRPQDQRPRAPAPTFRSREPDVAAKEPIEIAEPPPSAVPNPAPPKAEIEAAEAADEAVKLAAQVREQERPAGAVLKAQAAQLCANCKYWDQDEDDPAQTMIPGWPATRRMCRRYPVELFKEPNDWCGEFST
jgi:hypothetical protein